MSQGEETFELVKESNDWRIFLNWAAGMKIPLRLDLSKSTDLDVALSKNEFVLQPGEVFEIVLKIKNHAKQPVTVRIGHLVEPSSIADFLDFVQCGFLLPVTVQPEKEQEFSGTYMLRGSLPEGIRQLNLTYDFRQLQ
jgi:cytochrome c oxidase assembly protein Cox11